MANVKITELTAITAPASSDVLAIVDVDADVTKKVTIADLVGSAAPGSFGAPSFGFADDDDTGMYRAAADQLGFATTGAERFRIDDAGNLHISGDSKYLYLSSDDNQWIRADASTDFIQFGTSNSERLRIDSSGNVGIGEASPGANLHVKSSGATEIKSESTGDNALVSINNSSSVPWILTQRSDTSNGFSFRYSGNNYVNIDTSGNVGIGVTSIGNIANRSQLVIGGSSGGLLQFDYGSTNEGRIFVSDSQFVIRASESDGKLIFQTGGNTEQMRIDSSGNVGIGTSSPSSELQVNGDSDTQIRVVCSSGGSAGIQLGDTSDVVRGGINFDATGNNLSFRGYNNTERMVIGSAGNVTIKTLSSASAAAYYNPPGRYPLNIDLTQGEDNWFNFAGPYNATVGTGSYIRFRSTFLNTGNHAGMYAGGLSLDSQHTAFVIGSIYSSSSTSGSAVKYERMRVLADGVVLIGTTSTSVAGGGSGTKGHRVSPSGITLQVAADVYPPAAFNRANNDGSVVEIRQGGTTEGTISVSGTTVSYNGGHLARWSQLPGGAERTEILRGSVLSNLDEMCEWGDEGNEQLNRMQVSSVEGDPNVSGVFQAWDDDDDTYTNDFYCAMTGDFVIRIAQGTTVARGDLLMSAGDGTAKPQDDDIVRSKTIAKVTSTTVSETYSDGSYCVPCVLMAC